MYIFYSKLFLALNVLCINSGQKSYELKTAYKLKRNRHGTENRTFKEILPH